MPHHIFPSKQHCSLLPIHFYTSLCLAVSCLAKCFALIPQDALEHLLATTQHTAHNTMQCHVIVCTWGGMFMLLLSCSATKTTYTVVVIQ